MGYGLDRDDGRGRRGTGNRARRLGGYSNRYSFVCPLNVVGARGYSAAASGPIGMEELAARLIDALESVSAEEVALGLQQVGGQARGAESIVKRKGRGKRRRGDAGLD